MKAYFGFSLLLFFPSLIFAQNWNTGSGGNSARNGLSTERGPAEEILLWEGGLNAVIAQQAVIDGDVVAMSRIYNIGDVLDGTDIVAQDLKTGEFLWSAVLPIEFPMTDWRNRVSAMGNGHVYATRSGNTNMSYLYALDVQDGSIIWRSEDLIDESSTESLALTEDGDLIVGNNRSVIRIDHTTGATMWKTDRSTPTSNGQEVALYEDKGFFWQPSPFGPTITMIDLETGFIEHETEALTPGIVQQLAPFVGPDGVVYAPRSMNNVTTDSLFALELVDGKLIKRWSVPIGYIPFSTSAVSPMGYVFTYGRDGSVIKVSPSGEIVAQSEPILPGSSSSPRMCLDGAGRVYVTNGEFAEGAFYVYDNTLNLLWSTPVRNVNIGGPAVGRDGTLIICGVGTDVRAYQGITTAIQDVTDKPIIEAHPNPTTDQVVFKMQDRSGQITIQWYDAQGQLLDVHDTQVINGQVRVEIGHLPSGTYLPRIIMKDGVIETTPVVRM